MGTNRMQQRVLRELADVTARPLPKLSLKKSQQLREVPDDWKKANHTPVSKMGRKEVLGNYKQVSLTLTPPEHMKTLFFTIKVVKHCNRLQRDVVESPSMEMPKWTQSWATCSSRSCLEQ